MLIISSKEACVPALFLSALACVPVFLPIAVSLLWPRSGPAVALWPCCVPAVSLPVSLLCVPAVSLLCPCFDPALALLRVCFLFLLFFLLLLQDWLRLILTFIRLKKLLFILVSKNCIKIDALLNNFLLPSLNVFKVINLSEDISATYYKFNTSHFLYCCQNILYFPTLWPTNIRSIFKFPKTR